MDCYMIQDEAPSHPEDESFFGEEFKNITQSHDVILIDGLESEPALTEDAPQDGLEGERDAELGSAEVGPNILLNPSTHYPFPVDDLDEEMQDGQPNQDDDDVPLTEDLDDEFVTDGLITPEEGEVISILVTAPGKLKAHTMVVELPETTLLTPRSCYSPYDPGCPTLSEMEAVNHLTRASKSSHASSKPGDFIEFQLDNFAVYQAKDAVEEMRSLHQLDTKNGHGDFCFDGILSAGGLKFFVKGVPITAVPIGDYGTLSKHTVRDKIWLQSQLNRKTNVYYRLGSPAKEYRRFFDPFLWVADLAKHFVDFLKVMGEHKRKVTIFHFRTTFSTWLQKVHKTNPAFVAWREQHPSRDFRTSIVANVGFLHKEAVGVLDYSLAYFHTLWNEILHYNHYKPVVNKKPDPPTVVTQYIYDCFESLPFAHVLEVVPLSEETKRLRKKLIRERNLEPPSPIHKPESVVYSSASKDQIQAIKPGDTITTHRDGEESGTKWQRQEAMGFADVDRWFALVQKVHIDKRGRRTFDVIWYYRAVDTLCGVMKYPWANELFLSDHCSCGEQNKISEDQVLGVHNVEFFGSSSTTAEFFCRQIYIKANKEQKWITLKKSDLRCRHVKPAPEPPVYNPGETLLVVLDSSTKRSEPCEFICSFDADGVQLHRLRRLLRRNTVDRKATNARRNELVYSEEVFEVRQSRIKSPCQVRFFRPGDPIPTPYDRDGVGAFFYITHQAVYSPEGAVSYVPLTTFPSSLKQGYDPEIDIPKLRGFDLFCGGGNFGRGLEDGGAIEMKWANDYDTKAIHTYMANVSAPEAVSPFLGSIDDLQRLAIQGKFSRKVPPIGEVDFVSGGSPCPGFSALTNDKSTPQQRKNQSLVAAFASFVDLYRPKYGVLENVVGIVQTKARHQDVFGQLLCAIVGLGYQTEFFFIDASECGSPQRRSRIFVVFAAPGCTLPRRPLQTHAHPSFTRPWGVGVTASGEKFAERTLDAPTPFGFVSASAATADLPRIYDAKPDICVPFPDHRISLGLTRKLRTKVQLIPVHPWGMNFAQAWYGPGKKRAGSGRLTAAERAFFPKDSPTSKVSRVAANSNAYGRQFPDRLIETVVTSQSPSDAKNGRTLHWRENRVLTIMEARRAQGFRDEDVLLGLAKDQYRVVGNSVAREVALALGVVIREAWVSGFTGAPGEVDDGIESVALSETRCQVFNPRDESASESSAAETECFSHRTSPRQTPATSICSPAPSPIGSKRARSTSIAVEIRASKVGTTDMGGCIKVAMPRR